jgi:hypothetical protein
MKCKDPCPGVCGVNTYCSVINHTPMCHCNEGFNGNPFESCKRVPESKIVIVFFVGIELS